MEPMKQGIFYCVGVGPGDPELMTLKAVRTLEAAGADGQLHAGSSWTNIFIYPGYKFRLVDDLVTNFHLPQSTLLMLVSTLSTREIMLQTYKKAVEEKYRFFSFGDAMFITDLNK